LARAINRIGWLLSRNQQHGDASTD